MYTLLRVVLSLILSIAPIPNNIELVVASGTQDTNKPPSFDVEGFFISLNPPITLSSITKGEPNGRIVVPQPQNKDKQETQVPKAGGISQGSQETSQPTREEASKTSHDVSGGVRVLETIQTSSVVDLLHKKTVETWGEGQWSAMYLLIMSESGFNPNIYNASSGACGIFQALPCSKMGGMEINNQIAWGVNYIKDRYGTPSNAWAFHLRMNWY